MRLLRILTRLALINTRHDAQRSLFTLLGILLGVYLISMILILSTSFTASLQNLLEEFGSNHIYVTPSLNLLPGGNARVFHDASRSALENLPGVKGVIGLSMRTARVTSKGESHVLPLMFITLDNPGLIEKAYKFDTLLRQGRFFTRQNEQSTILGADVADKIFQHTLSPGMRIHIDTHSVKIIGVYTRLGTPDDRNLYLPYTLGQAWYGLQGYDYLDLVLEEHADTTLLTEKIKRVIKRLEGFKPVILTPEALQENVNQTLRLTTLFLSLLASVSIFISLLSMLNTFMARTEQRKRVLGTLRALGMRKKDIILLTMLEAGMLSLLATLAGVSLGILTNLAITPLLTTILPHYTLTIPTPTLILLTLGMTSMSMLLASIPPWLIQCCTPPIRLLKDE